MTNLNITSGQTLIIEGVDSNAVSAPTPAKPAPVEQVEAGIRRHEVPADNHCLFYSIYFLMNEGQIDKKSAQALRSRISQHILDNYCEDFQLWQWNLPLWKQSLDLVY